MILSLTLVFSNIIKNVSNLLFFPIFILLSLIPLDTVLLFVGYLCFESSDFEMKKTIKKGTATQIRYFVKKNFEL